ncbi:MAG: thioredoxin [Pseudomonadota bacterium]
MAIQELQPGTDLQQLLDASDRPVVIDFWAPWCGPCRAISPALEALAEARHGEIDIIKVNVDQHQLAADTYGVRAIPTLVFVDDGEEQSRQVGALSTGQLSRWFDNARATIA